MAFLLALCGTAWGSAGVGRMCSASGYVVICVLLRGCGVAWDPTIEDDFLLNINMATFRFTVVGGFAEHRNRVSECAEQLGYTRIGDITKKQGDSFASERGLMYMDNNTFASFTSSGAAVCECKSKKVIGSNKNNACPFIIFKHEDQIIIWHVSYSDVLDVKTIDELFAKLPWYIKLYEDGPHNISVTDLIFNKSATSYTTSEKLHKMFISAGYNISLMSLPNGLEIVSSGLESSIRSYSIGIFRDVDADRMVLSGNKTWICEDFKTWEEISN